MTRLWILAAALALLGGCDQRTAPRGVDEPVFRIQANAQKAGDHILRVQISSNEWPTPVTREESTRVYLDR